ncbi:MAG: LPS export ABC transporter permease LptG [Gammaproteobacteria bacterium]|nr:LPS export ABC transporter permease LptG [Gammaproteobacteria bacterium]
MSLLDRYIFRAVIVGTLLTALVLMTILILLHFMAELQYLQGDFTALKAAEFSILTNMRILRDLFPMMALIGSLLGLGMLANNNELTVMRAAGVSVGRITLSVMKVGLLMMLVVALFSEYVVPISEQYAKTMRAAALNKKVFIGGRSGLWMRDGNVYINARTLKNNERITNVNVYEINESGEMTRSFWARQGRFMGDHWLLTNVRESHFSADGVRVENHKQRQWYTSLQPDIVDVVSIAPIDLSLSELTKIIQHLNVNEQNASRHEVAFWSKVFSPIATGAMIFLSIPFVFGSLRSVPISQRLVNGTLLGIGFYLFNEGATRFGVVYQVPPFLSAAIPTILISLFAWYKFRRVY